MFCDRTREKYLLNWLAKEVARESLPIPIIGIGAGGGVDGQVLGNT